MYYNAISHNLSVTVKPEFLESESRPAEHFYAWTYYIEVENKSDAAVQLLTRHWEITDANGIKQIIDGEGVVGQQPIINPGQIHSYSSWTWLNTPSGIMQGHYGMLLLSQATPFNITIPLFSLDSPQALRLAN